MSFSDDYLFLISVSGRQGLAKTVAFSALLLDLLFQSFQVVVTLLEPNQLAVRGHVLTSCGVEFSDRSRNLVPLRLVLALLHRFVKSRSLNLVSLVLEVIELLLIVLILLGEIRDAHLLGRVEISTGLLNRSLSK